MKKNNRRKQINGSLKVLFLFNGIFVFASTLLGPLYDVFVETIDSNVLVGLHF